MDNVPIERALSLHAAGQHGLVIRSAALQLGLTQPMINTKLAKGNLVRVGRGLYRVAGAPVTWEQKLLATLGVPAPVRQHEVLIDGRYSPLDYWPRIRGPGCVKLYRGP